MEKAEEYKRAAEEYYRALQAEAYRLVRVREVQTERQGEANIDLLTKIYDVKTELERTKKIYREVTGRELNV